MGWLITSLINEGWSEKDAWFAVCTDSRELGHYWNSWYVECEPEPTGSRKIAGKCDLANVLKFLAEEKKLDGYWIGGGFHYSGGYHAPIANCNFGDRFAGIPNDFAVGWLVL